jgi:hypothetical protein
MASFSKQVLNITHLNYSGGQDSVDTVWNIQIFTKISVECTYIPCYLAYVISLECTCTSCFLSYLIYVHCTSRFYYLSYVVNLASIKITLPITCFSSTYIYVTVCHSLYQLPVFTNDTIAEILK